MEALTPRTPHPKIWGSRSQPFPGLTPMHLLWLADPLSKSSKGRLA